MRALKVSYSDEGEGGVAVNREKNTIFPEHPVLKLEIYIIFFRAAIYAGHFWRLAIVVLISSWSILITISIEIDFNPISIKIDQNQILSRYRDNLISINIGLKSVSIDLNLEIS